MKSELAETSTLADIGAVLELQHPDGSRAFLKLGDLVNAPNTLRAVWGSVVGVRNPAVMAEQLIEGATAPTDKGAAMIEEQETDWAADGAAAVRAAERAEEQARHAELNRPKPQAVFTGATEAERAAAIKWQSRHFLEMISPGRRRAAAAKLEARKPLDAVLIAMLSEREEAAKAAALQAAEAVRADYAQRVAKMEQLFREGKDWRAAR